MKRQLHLAELPRGIFVSFAPSVVFLAAAGTLTMFVAMLPVRVQAGCASCSCGGASFMHEVAACNHAAISFTLLSGQL
jgi:predicted dithiol-disulfide oxidoreductase (DUF899 family)